VAWARLGAMLDDGFLAPHAIARWAADTPDAIAVDLVRGGQRTYAEMLAASQRWASAFAAHGVGHGTHVATMLHNDLAALDAWLGLGWLRAVEVPLNTAYQGAMLQYALELSDAVLLVIEADFLDRLLPLVDSLPLLTQVVVVGGAAPVSTDRVAFRTTDELLAGHEPRSFEGPHAHDIEAIIFTSGTTGPSKGVLVPWGSAYQMFSWVPADAFEPGEGVYTAFQPFHIAGKSVNNSVFVRGGRMVLRDKFSAASFLDDVRRHECAAACIVGPMTAIIHAQPRRPDDADNPLRCVLLGPMIPEMADFEERFGVRTATCYGMTEIGAPVATTWDHGPWQTCGRSRTDWPWTEIRLVDEHDHEVPAGQVGEMIVRSEPWALNQGYYKMPEKTAEAWRNGWFHTGDAFRRDADGNYEFVDRLKDAIRRRGENISSFEVENAVLEHPDVVDCSAIGVPAKYGEDEVMVIVVAKDRAAFDPAALVAWLDSRMPRFMVPRYVDIVDELPRNETSLRVKKMELRQRGVTPTTWDREASDR
jgi:crotonobetaine/carnitine-CoA ligase